MKYYNKGKPVKSRLKE